MAHPPDMSIDVNIARKNSLVDNSLRYFENIPLFSVVELNICNICTRACDFCPIAYPEYTARRGMMSDAVIHSLIASLKRINYEGILIFSGFCEPLLHPALVQYVVLFRKALPKMRIEVITNGDLLTLEKCHMLFEAGLTTLCVSVYDGIDSYRQFEDFRVKHHFSEQQIVLRRRFYSENNYGFIFSNRSGLIRNDMYGHVHEHGFPIRRSCNYPFYYTFIDTDGSILSCPHDWLRQSVFGNVLQDDLFYIWKNETSCSLRKHLYAQDRSAPQCLKCSTNGLVMGAQHARDWARLL